MVFPLRSRNSALTALFFSLPLPLSLPLSLPLLSLASPAAYAALPELTAPGWAQLSDPQKKLLAPLAREWDSIESFRRKKWLGIAARYEKFSPEEQQRIQERMREWARLAPEERRLAREKYKKLSKVSPEQRQSLRQNWEEYQALSAEERQRLQDKAVRRSPASTVPPSRPSIRKPASDRLSAAPPTTASTPPPAEK